MCSPLAAHCVVFTLAFICLFPAFILLILVALSLPIIKPVYLLSLDPISLNETAASIAPGLRFGVWGVCASVLNDTGSIVSDGLCFGPQLGYEVPGSISSLLGIAPALVQAVQQNLFVGLVLHPVAAGLALLTLIFSLFLASHCMAIMALILVVITAIISSVAMAIDLALIVGARNKVAELTELNFVVNWGNGIWMVLAAVVLIWLSVICFSARACYCCGVRRASVEQMEAAKQFYTRLVPMQQF